MTKNKKNQLHITSASAAFSVVVLLFFALPVFHVHAATVADADITSDTTWDANGSPYVISGSPHISFGATLTILSGVVVKFDLNSEIIIDGTLLAGSSNGATAYFTSIADDTLGDLDGMPSEPRMSDYTGFVFDPGSHGIFGNVEMRYARNAISETGSDLSIKNGTFINNNGGIFTAGGKLDLQSSRFLNGGSPLAIDVATSFIHSGNIFAGNAYNSIGLSGDSSKASMELAGGDAPYILLASLTISSGHMLTIDPGVTIRSDGVHDYLTLDGGTMQARGTPDAHIVISDLGLNVWNGAVLDMAYADISDQGEQPIEAKNGSTVTLSETSIKNTLAGNAIVIGGNCSLTADSLLIDTARFNGISAVGAAALAVTNSRILHSGIHSQGIEAAFGVVGKISNTTIDGCNNGILAELGSALVIDSVTVKNCTGAGIESSDGSSGNTKLSISNSEITANRIGMSIASGTTVAVTGNRIYGNGIGATTDSTVPVVMTGNWWGDISGPYNEKHNAAGKGNPVSDMIDFSGWSQLHKVPILIVPGVLGTEIYKGNTKLWPSILGSVIGNGDEFMDPLQFNSILKPIDPILTIGEVVGKPISLFDYSEGLLTEFQNQGYTQGQNSTDNLFLFPYDWRYGVTGVIAGTNKTTVDVLQQKIQDVMAQTGSNKVDIVAHSTGGLLVKKYVMDHPTDNHIGKAVFVGVPNTGAPKAVKVLLAGDSFGNPLLSSNEMKKIAANLPVIYDLLPSLQYFNDKGSYINVVNQKLLSVSSKVLTFNQTNDFLTIDHGFNAAALANAQALHTQAFDNYDMRTANVDLYAIDGCKAGTLENIVETRHEDMFAPLVDYQLIKPEVGDGTVPIESSTNLKINQDHKYFALSSDHGKMISQQGIRQQIVNIISGSTLSTEGVNPVTKDPVKIITQNFSECGLNGKGFQVFSPLDLDIVDQDGNHSGRASDGVSIENTIPNAMYEVMGEHKYVYLPYDDGQTYTIGLKGTGTGTFTLKVSDIQHSDVTETQVFSNIPVTANLRGKVSVASPVNSPVALALDTNGDGTTDASIMPNTTVNADQSSDILAPNTAAAISGTAGKTGFYRSTVAISLSGVDPIALGQESQTSGLQKTNFSLDNGGYQTYGAPIQVSAEGSHTLAFFSTDKAGNNEDVQTVTFTIDKTAPELTAGFDPSVKDIKFAGTDNISAPLNITVADADDTITATDQAGNQTVLKLKQKSRKILMAADIKSLLYNGVSADVSKNILGFLWLFDKKNNLVLLSQSIQSKKSYSILAVYDGKNTALIGKDALGKILKSVSGLALLKVSTNKGDLTWGY